MAFPHGAPGFLRDVVALGHGVPISFRSVAVPALGVIAPVGIGLAIGQFHLGLLAALGCVLLGAPSSSSLDVKQRIVSTVSDFAPVSLAIGAAALIADKPWGDAVAIALVSGAGLLAGYSRPVAVAAIRFGVCLVLGLSLLSAPAADSRGIGALAFAAGALWGAGLGLLPRGGNTAAAKKGRPAISPRARRVRFFRTLRTLGGWQFPLRLALGLGIASAIRHFWPAHHFYWIMLTVAVLTAPAIEPLPVKTAQRLAGTLGGVAFAALLRAGLPSPVWLALAACPLAILLPIARTTSYLLYSIVVTPLILLALDIGAPETHGLFIDRLTATFAAGAIVLALNMMFDRIGVAGAKAVAGNPLSTP